MHEANIFGVPDPTDGVERADAVPVFGRETAARSYVEWSEARKARAM